MAATGMVIELSTVLAPVNILVNHVEYISPFDNVSVRLVNHHRSGRISSTHNHRHAARPAFPSIPDVIADANKPPNAPDSILALYRMAIRDESSYEIVSEGTKWRRTMTPHLFRVET